MRHESSFASLLAVGMFASVTQAQSVDQNAGVEEVIVTAQKRAERLQDVPLAVTAVSGAMLANQQIDDTIDLVKAVPSLSSIRPKNADRYFGATIGFKF